MNNNLLKLKTLTPAQKLVILLILDTNPILNFKLTSQEIANELGLKRKEVLTILADLEEMGYIKCNVASRTRTTIITKLFKSIINESK